MLAGLLVLVAAAAASFGFAAPGYQASGTAVAGRAAAIAGGLSGCLTREFAAPRELRGMWLTTVRNTDWPSKPGLTPEQVKAEYVAWLDFAVKLNHNAIFVHVRPSGDAFWPSAYAPWSYWLTGSKDGADPGWDPMAFMVAEAHARNLEFHAWFNPYKAAQEGDVAQLAANHPLRQHPEWAVGFPASGSSRRLYYNPGIPDARAYVENSILEAVTRYDLDAVHFDDFFYPYPEKGQDFPDAAAFAQYGAGMSKADWRRHNVDTFVKNMSERIRAAKPTVKFGISPFGIWRNSDTDPAGSATRGLESYDAIYADTRKWVKEGWLDYIVPQLYWHIGFAIADYAVLLPWWSKLVEGTKTQLYIGMADYRVGQAGAWKDPTVLTRQLALNDKYGVHGTIHFNAKSVRADRLGATTRYRTAHYATPALIPVTARLAQPAPQAPSDVLVRRTQRSATVTWSKPSTGAAPARYVVYRADSLSTPARLMAVVRATGTSSQSWLDTSAGFAEANYCVTALDRNWAESGP